MHDATLLFASFAVNWLGFALLALSQSRHRAALAAPHAPSPWRLALQRGAGTLLLAIALVLAWLRDGPSFGSVMWALLLSLAAVTVSFVLAWRPHWLAPFARWLRKRGT